MRSQDMVVVWRLLLAEATKWLARPSRPSADEQRMWRFFGSEGPLIATISGTCWSEDRTRPDVDQGAETILAFLTTLITGYFSFWSSQGTLP